MLLIRVTVITKIEKKADRKKADLCSGLPGADYSIPRTGSVILNGLQKVITEIRHLETICPDHASELEHCEEQLKGIAVEVASVCTEGESTDQFESMIKDAGIEIS